MSATMFNDQQILAGQKLGISTAKAFALIAMSLGLGAMNIYHMGNSITSKLLTPDSNIMLFILLYFIASCIAFIEVPLTEEITTLKAKNEASKIKTPVFGYQVMLSIVACMAVAGGVYSMTTDAEKVDARRTGHDTHSSSFEDLKQGLISNRNAARQQALSFDSSVQRQVETSRANADYFKALAKLKIQYSAHQVSRPTQAVETGTVWHWLWTIGFSLLCSLGVIVITNYLTKYHKPLTEIPRVFFKVKDQQEWLMQDDDVRVIPAQVDLSGGSSTGAARKALDTPSPTPENENLTSASERALENRPAPATINVGAVSDADNGVSVRTLNDDPERVPKIEYSKHHYEAIKAGVIDGSIKPTMRPIKNGLVSLNIKFVDDATRQKKATSILAQLLKEGVLIDNPEFGLTGKVVAKYILNSDYSEQGSNLKSKEELIAGLPKVAGFGVGGLGVEPEYFAGAEVIAGVEDPDLKQSGEDDSVMSCQCPECGKLEAVEQVNKSGKVRSVCGAVYIAADNLVDSK